MANEILIGFVVFVFGFLTGEFWTLRYRLISKANWQVYLANLHSPKAMIDDTSGEVIFANKSFERLFNLKMDESSFEFKNPQDRQTVIQLIRRRHWPQPFIDVTSDFRSSSVSNVPHHARFSGLPIFCGRQKIWVVSLEPESEVSSCEPVGHRDAQLYRSILNSLVELVCFKNPEGKIIGTNLAYDRFWRGREADGRELSQEKDFHSRQTDQRWTTDPNGDSCLLEINQTVLRDTNNQILGTLSICHDVTNWQLMQQRLTEQIKARELIEEKLQRRSNVLRSIFDASLDPIGIYTKHYDILGANQAFFEMMGIRGGIQEGQSLSQRIDPEIFAEHQRTDGAVLLQGQTVKYENLVVNARGEQVWYEITKTQFRDVTDDTTGVLTIGRDVTDRKAAQQQLADAIMELQMLSFSDGLTQVANRRRLDEALLLHWQQHQRDQEPLSLIMCDIDCFKAYNDNYGHQEGDRALIAVADIFKKMLRRPLDLVARYGGEEFVILLPNTEQSGAEVVAQNIASGLDALNIEHGNSLTGCKLTLSQGVATFIPQQDSEPYQLIAAADKALYQAKHAGRNQIVIA